MGRGQVDLVQSSSENGFQQCNGSSMDWNTGALRAGFPGRGQEARPLWGQPGAAPPKSSQAFLVEAVSAQKIP